jgi:hypothetical protein
MSYVIFNPNPLRKSVGDCAIRAIAAATNRSWDYVYLALTVQGFMMCDWGNSNTVWDSYLKSRGFKKNLIPDTCPDCYTVKDFCIDHPRGTFVLGTGDHVVTVKEGNYYDAWDSGDEVPLYFYAK